MTQLEKLIMQFLTRPTSLRYPQIEKIPAKGSHVKFKHPQLTSDLIIPVHNNNCKDFYKTLALKIIKTIT